jgi:ABC-type glycerol-3-phosphate transport system permease component
MDCQSDHLEKCATALFNLMSITRIPRRQINEKERIEENLHFLTVRLAAIVIYAIPLVIFFFFAQRYIMEGVVDKDVHPSFALSTQL